MTTRPLRRRLGVLATESGLGLLTTALKMAAALVGGSIPLWSDALRTGVSAGRDVVGWISLHALRGDEGDADHDPGKAEGLFALTAVAVMLLVQGLLLVLQWRRIADPAPAGPLLPGVAITGLAALGSLVLWIESAGAVDVRGHRAADYGTRTLANLAIALPLGVALFAPSIATAMQSLAMVLTTGFVLRTAYELGGESLSVLLDETLEESYQLIILRQLATHFDEYTAFHGIRSRRSGGRAYIQVFLEFEPTRTLGEAQRVMDRITRDIEDSIQNARAYVVPSTRRVR